VAPATASQSIHIVKVANRIIPFPYGGGNVTYTYAVTNPSNTPISNVMVTDDKCSPVTFITGDTNNDHLLNTNEVWTYTCSTHISVSTRNVATVTGEANGVTVSATDSANVVVNPLVSVVPVVTPKLPKTGILPEGESTPRNIILLADILMIVSTTLVVVSKKRTI
jgi:uncharacterized repeat protein (TIGR01451 family)